MKRRVNEKKSAAVKKERGAAREEIAENGELLDTLQHPSDVDRFLLIIRFEDYVWVVVVGKVPPRYVTAYKSRKMHKRYMK